jgi:urease accessory protein
MLSQSIKTAERLGRGSILMPAMHDDWIIWQLLDSSFPSGAFAHSGGLESAWQQGFFADARELRSMAEAFLVQQARGPAVLTIAACRQAERFAELDALAEAMLANHVANRASRAQGAALAHAAARTFGVPTLRALAERIACGQTPGHGAPVLGIIVGGLGLSAERSSRVAVFLALRSVLSAAVRLGALGAFEAQALQRTLADSAERAAALALTIGPADAAQAAPVLDLVQQTHDRLYSRLFQS